VGEPLLALVLGTNVLAVLAWFLLSGLKRNHEGVARSLRDALADLRARADGEAGGGGDAGGDGDLQDRARELLPLVAELEGRLAEAEGAGPLAGRAPLRRIQADVVGLCARFPEFVA